MNAFWYDFCLESLELIGRLFLAAVCGLVIGFERRNRKKEAGIRTHIIVALASCLMMEISKYGFSDLGDFDGSRLAAQVVSGIGFLGAGMIFVHKNSIKGLTTAAGIWATSGIGMAVGAGMYVIGIVTTLFIFVLQIILHKNIRHLSHINNDTIIFVAEDGEEAIDTVQTVLKDCGLSCESVSIAKIPENHLRIEVNVTFPDDFDMFEFTKNACKIPGIKSVCNDLN